MLLKYAHYEQCQRAINPLLRTIFAAFNTSLIGIEIIDWNGETASQGQVHFLAISILNIDSAKLKEQLPPELTLLEAKTEKPCKQEHYLCFTGNSNYPLIDIIQNQKSIRLET